MQSDTGTGYSFGGAGVSGMASTATDVNGGTGASSLRELIATKERELHDINEYRLQSLEALLTEKVRFSFARLYRSSRGVWCYYSGGAGCDGDKECTAENSLSLVV